jgi:hypothetical protein
VIIEAEAALTDFNKGEEQQGLMYCFCKSYWQEDRLGNYKFSDGSKHCQTWVQMYALTNTLVYCVPLMISFVNYISKMILRLMTHLEKRQSIPE